MQNNAVISPPLMTWGSSGQYPPTQPVTGTVYFNAAIGSIMMFDGQVWKLVSEPSFDNTAELLEK